MSKLVESVITTVICGACLALLGAMLVQCTRASDQSVACKARGGIPIETSSAVYCVDRRVLH